MVVPDAAVPRWSPGPGWMEMATARMWAKPAADGLLVAVRTYGRDADGYATNDEVLATGLVLDLYGSLADKRHRIYQYAEPGALRTELIEPDQPAERYRAYWLEFTARFEQTIEQTQDEVDFPPRERTLDLRPEVSLRPDGRSWVCSVDVSLSPKRSYYWWDLACCTEVLVSTARVRDLAYRDLRRKPTFGH